jgi:hypothetical protein
VVMILNVDRFRPGYLLGFSLPFQPILTVFPAVFHTPFTRLLTRIWLNTDLVSEFRDA